MKGKGFTFFHCGAFRVSWDAEAMKAAVFYWKRKSSQQKTVASTSILFGLNLRSNYMLKSLISIR